ncbi:plasmid mobilization protein [Streptococcus suis]|uniref:plasmid mobilization protein n=1 Tax=Streptococcus suis TaxID=1307 RepID=UPI0004625A73|nr:plasmid mobilization relaxosome protein MobC [Streptococcus suis]HEM3180818.1 plasmid mobilization relaxosome protein MobC [Streptococcus suis 92-4172]
MVERKRYIQRKFRVTPEENQDIKVRMKAAGLKNFENYARLMTLTGKVVVVNFDGLIDLRKEINSIGVNINQIAKVANTDEQVSTEQVVTLLNGMKRIEDLLTEIANKNIMKAGQYDGLYEGASD